MTEDRARPIVGLPACLHEFEDLPFHAAGEKYLTAIAGGAGCLPWIVPSLGVDGDHGHDIAEIVALLDGLLVTGSPSNVDPGAYGGPPSRAGTRHDPARDATALPLIAAAIEAGVPVLALCRGIQELNVVFGGTLHQNLQDLPGRLDHRADPSAPVEVRYAPAHPVRLEPGGALAALAGEATMTVNSLHAQGIDRLGSGLVVEASAPDGTIEAVRVEDAEVFALGIQWHPEWRYWESAFALRLFAAFGDAVRAAAGKRKGNRASPRGIAIRRDRPHVNT